MKRIPLLTAFLLSFVLSSSACESARAPVASTGPCSQAVVTDRQEVHDKVVASTMILSIEKPSASGGTEGPFGGVGTVLGPTSLLVAAHVVRDAVRITAVPMAERGTPSGQQTRMTLHVETVAADADVAMLAPDGDATFSQPALPAHVGAPVDGQAVGMLNRDGTLRFGTILRADVNVPGRNGLIETGFASHGGDSGAPLVDRCGNLEGILLLGNHTNRTYFAPLDTAVSALGIPCAN